MRSINSFLVCGSSRKQPRIELVTVFALTFCTPRMTIHIWLHSITTATPLGSMASSMATAISRVSRSCTCNVAGKWRTKGVRFRVAVSLLDAIGKFWTESDTRIPFDLGPEVLNPKSRRSRRVREGKNDFTNLQAATEDLGNASDFAQAKNFTFGDICDM